METIELTQEEFDSIPVNVTEGENRTEAKDGLVIKKKSIDGWLQVSYKKSKNGFDIDFKIIKIIK